MGYLEQHADPGLPAQPAWDHAAHAAAEATAAAHAASVLAAAAAMPRRLGGEASREQLARDKVLARRYAHVLAQAARAWGADTEACAQATPKVRRQGAQVDLAVWAAERTAHVRAARTAVATHCLRLGLRQLGNAYVRRYGTELAQLAWAAR